MRTAQKRSESGFTLVEVMIAIGIMTMGSLGILSMHQAVARANRSAREMNTAIAITERWIERVERDSLSWTEQGLTSSELSSTEFLKTMAGSVTQTDWFTPTKTSGFGSYAFNYAGEDTDTAKEIKYCVNLRLTWLRQGSSARVDVRTFWYRPGFVTGGAKHTKWVDPAAFRGASCDAATADGWDLGEAPNVDVIFASTVVSWLRLEGV